MIDPEDEKNIQEIFEELRLYHMRNGAAKKEAETLSFIDTYRLRTWKKIFDPAKVPLLEYLIKETFTQYRDIGYVTSIDILTALYNLIENIIIDVEKEREDAKQVTVKHRLYLQDGELVDNIHFERE